ncbi:MAG TPA: tail fiber domain-containing protein, partial [Blastocatellia bacterium]|nr:tail fiber domain-containing protein [Blastocatellia bacterium]
FSISGEGDATIAGRVSCGGWIAFKTWHGSYVTANDDRATMRQNPTRQTWEQFTLEMACSRELKENISDISVEEAMTTLEALNPIRYDYKGQKAFRQNLGFIAEEMPDNLASEDRKSVSPFEVIPVLTRVAKEQQKTIARLQETIRALQEEVRRNLVSTVPTTGPILSTNALGE